MTYDLFMSPLAEYYEWLVPTLQWSLSPVIPVILHQMELRLEFGIPVPVTSSMTLTYDLFISFSLAEWPVPALQWSLSPVIAVLLHPMELRLELGIRGILRVIPEKWRPTRGHWGRDWEYSITGKILVMSLLSGRMLWLGMDWISI